MPGAVACVLFTDLVGSTELMARLGDAAFDGLRAEHFTQLRQAITAHGGVEIKNTGDGVLATFVSAVEGLAAAVEAQQATDRQGRRTGVPLQLRVGLALGEVAAEAGDVFGTPVVEAARLVGAARPGQILCTALVRAVAGSRAAVFFTDVGALDLKGLPDAVPACEVVWEPAALRQVGDPRALAHVLMIRGFALLGTDTARQRRVEAAELVALAQDLADPAVSFYGSFNQFITALEFGDRVEAEGCLRWSISWPTNSSPGADRRPCAPSSPSVSGKSVSRSRLVRRSVL